MKEITRSFLNSDMVESDFYNLPKKDLINLRDYILQLQEKDKEFMDLVREPVSSMKTKCSWIDDVAFDGRQIESTGEYYSSSIWLFPTEGHNLITKLDRDDKIYKDIADKIPTIYRLNKTIRTQIKRQGELKNIQDELHDIDQIGREFYDGLLYRKKSISGDFDMLYTPNIGMYVFNDDELVADYLVRKMRSYDKPYLKGTNKRKILTRIQVKPIKTSED